MLQQETITKQIVAGSLKGQKSYIFDDSHDPSLPAQMWFQRSQEGYILFVVFYSQACRWSRCLGCNLPSKMSSKHIGYKDLIAQITHLFADEQVIAAQNSIHKVIVSNNGSILDQETFSSIALMYLLVQLKLNFPQLTVLSIETRPEYVDLAELEFIGRALAEGDTPAQLEIAIGFEAFDDHIRNNIFDKGLTLEAFERLVDKMLPYQYPLKCYFMQKPIPEMSDAQAVLDIQQAIDYLDQVARRSGLEINMHLNPTYAAAGTLLEQAFQEGRYAPPQLRDVAKAVRHARGKKLSIFIGLSDEGLAVEGGSFLRAGEEDMVAALERFNLTQDYSILDCVCMA